MIFGMLNNPRTPLLSEIARAARLGFDFLDLTLEAPAAAPESTDWTAVRAALTIAVPSTRPWLGLNQ